MWGENYYFIIHMHKTVKEFLKVHLMISLAHAFQMGGIGGKQLVAD